MRICAAPACEKPTGKWRTLCITHAGRHNRAREPLRGAWTAMKQRCYNPNNISYHRYGGRGITVCDRWRNSFKQFKLDVGERPSPKHTLDRIDNNGDYEPSNVRWGSQTEQHMNRRLFSRNTSGVQGVSKSPKSAVLPWRAYVTKNRKQIHLGYFKTKQEAIEARQKGAIEYYGMPSLH